MFDSHFIEAEGASEAYTKMCELLDTKGHPMTTRGEPTLEVLNVSCIINDTNRRKIPIPHFNEGFILQEAYDILNENPPRVAHSKQMLEKTMGNSSNIMF